MKASRHNGRSGKHGVYDVKHNDRDFNVEHSEHIDAARTKQNIYWDCYQGYSFAGSSEERQFNFTEIERAYYFEHYGDFVDAQNERNELARHPERNRTVEDVLKNNKTCPEESVLQLGNIDHAVTPDVLAKVVAEFFDEFNKRYGSHIHILDWALHLDEGTPHVHERHAFALRGRDYREAIFFAEPVTCLAHIIVDFLVALVGVMIHKVHSIKNQMIVNMTFVNVGGQHILVFPTEYFIRKLLADLMGKLRRNFADIKGLNDMTGNDFDGIHPLLLGNLSRPFKLLSCCLSGAAIRRDEHFLIGLFRIHDVRESLTQSSSDCFDFSNCHTSSSFPFSSTTSS